MNSRILKAHVLIFLTMIFWGISWPVAKILVGIAPPMTIGFFRFLLASFLFAAFLAAQQHDFKFSIDKESLKWYLLLGLVGIFGYGVFFLVGLRFTTAAQGAIIAGLNPASVSLFAHVLLGERFSKKWKYLGIALSFLGVIFVIGVQALIDFRPDYIIGNILILGAVTCWGLYSSIGKKVMKQRSAFNVTAGAVFFGMMLFGLGALTERFWNIPGISSPPFILGIIILGLLVTFLGFYFYFNGIKILGASKASIYINLVPVFGTLFSALLLEETIYWTFIVGIILIVTGITMIQYPEHDNDKELIPRKNPMTLKTPFSR